MKKVVTFGEIMLRLSAPGNEKFIQSDTFHATYGGGEANVAVSLAQFGIRSAHVTRFPDNELGKAATNQLRQYGVDTNHIIYGGDRIGIYFLETGASVRPSKIIYDRNNSAFAGIEPDMIDWDEVFKDATWFHWTGITPAISEGAAACCRKAIKVANKKGITVSADINYRKNLWQYGKTASQVMPEMIEGCDIIVAGKSDAYDILGIEDQSSEDHGNLSVFSQIMQKFPKLKKVINTNRISKSASHNTLSGRLYDGTDYLKTETFEINPIVDRIGGGDAFMAGFIYGQLMYKDDKKALEFAVAASVLKHSVEGDANLVSVKDVESILEGNTTGRLVR